MTQKTNHTKACSAHVAINRGRVKHYGESVYLKNGQQFEIELFNPRNFSVLAKIYLNGNLISNSGVVLRPGQRVFLERFIEEDRKFLFETYEVENTSESLEAITENGVVEVLFFHEITVPVTKGISWTSQPYAANHFYTYTGGNTFSTNTVFTNSNLSYGGTTVNSAYTYTTNVNCSVAGSIETGRVEQGENSLQQFTETAGNFSIWHTENVKIQILPESKKPVEISEIRSYCTGCGTRVKKSSWKFCPSCGSKVD